MTPPLHPVASLLGAPIGDLDDIGAGDVAMVGLFLDHGDASRFGARFAARQVRYACALQTSSPPTGPLGRCLDLGDLNVFPLEPPRQTEALRRQIGRIAGRGAIPVVVGGRSLPLPLGACVGGGAVEEAILPGSAPDAPARVALRVDLAPILSASAEPRAASRLLAAVGAVPRHRIAAVHLLGFAPDLDVDGRREASLAAHVLEAMAAHLVGAVR